MKEINTKEEAKAHIIGRMAAYNDIRIAFWGIGYDKNETAQKVRKLTTQKIMELKEILNIEYMGSDWFSNATDFLKESGENHDAE